MARPSSALLLAACLACASRALAEDGMSCERGVVSVGDSRLDLLGKCGAPTLRESRPVQVTEWVGDRVQGFARTVTVTVETWTYDLGPGSLVRQARIEAGKLTGVRTGGYGRSREERRPGSAVPRAACEPSAIRPGDSTYDLLSRCGDPVFRDVREELVSVAEGNGQVAAGASTVVVRETWTYDFGPRALVRYVEVRDGGVTTVRTGGYGYSE